MFRSYGAWAVYILAFAGISESRAQVSGFDHPNPVPTAVAVRVKGTIHLDGILDEDDWKNATAHGEFVQREPFVGAAASERTEFRVLYDDENLYVGVVLYDREPAKLINRTRSPDSTRVFKDDLVSVNLDPQLDHRTVYGFTINALGTQLDGKGYENGTTYRSEWNTVWEAEARIRDDGWTAEIRIPFSSLEFDPKDRSEIGLNVTRQIARRAELADWAQVRPPFGSFHASEFGHLQGIEIPSKPWRRLAIIPYVASGFRENPTATAGQLPAHSREFVLDQGVDLKYPLTRSAVGQVTVRTDFSQVDIDDQQVRLNRFDLFFPEKRQFFLDGAQYFEFGVPEFAQLYFSRRIGLFGGEVVPILAGVRSYGSFGKGEYGFLNIQTEDTPSVTDRNVTVARVRENVGSRSQVGAIVVHSQDTSGNIGHNSAGGVDAAFRTEDARLTVETWAAGTHSDPQSAGSVEGTGASAYLRAVWTPGLWEVRQSDILISDGFNPATGYMERIGIFRPTFTLRRSFRMPERNIKEIKIGGAGNVVLTDEVDRLLDYTSQGDVTVTTNEGFSVYSSGSRFSDRVLAPFDLKTGVTVPPGRYTETNWDVQISTPSKYPLNGSFYYLYGGFFGGTIHQFVPTLVFTPGTGLYFRVKSTVSLVDLPALGAEYTSTAFNFSGSYAFYKGMALESNVGWNRDTDSLELQGRYRWRFAPLSDFFAVYNEERKAGSLHTTFRGLIFKIVVYLLM